MDLRFWLYLLVCIFLFQAPARAQAQAGGQVVDAIVTSQHLKDNLIGIAPERHLKIYLPAGYDTSAQRYPVIYFFHSILRNNKQIFEDGVVKALLDKSSDQKVTGKVIVVVGDFSTPHIGTFFANTPESGRWLDHTIDELVPYIDRNYRTLANRNSRGLAGEHLGGYAALKLGMLYPEKFSVVYALHPFGTGAGLTPMIGRPIWHKINRASSWKDLDGDIYAQVFMAMAQSYLPNPRKPPFYADQITELREGKAVPIAANIERLQSTFLLDQLVPRYAENLKKLTAIKFDWGRHDTNPDHVYGNQVFSRKLNEYGVPHFAEEYDGNQWEKNWIDGGRVIDSMMPFFHRHLVF